MWCYLLKTRCINGPLKKWLVLGKQPTLGLLPHQSHLSKEIGIQSIRKTGSKVVFLGGQKSQVVGVLLLGLQVEKKLYGKNVICPSLCVWRKTLWLVRVSGSQLELYCTDIFCASVILSGLRCHSPTPPGYLHQATWSVDRIWQFHPQTKGVDLTQIALSE